MKGRTVTSRNNYKDMGYYIILTLLNAFCIEALCQDVGGTEGKKRPVTVALALKKLIIGAK